MIKILSTYDLLKIEDTVLREHVEGIVNDIMNYNAVDSLESVGAIFVLESADEPLNPSLFFHCPSRSRGSNGSIPSITESTWMVSSSSTTANP